MTVLSQYTPGKDNNFNFIRMIAASAVLLSHSFALSRGSGNADPLFAHLGVTLGTLAVDLFFISSGFLVGASLMHRQSAVAFIRARVLRIYPALVAMVILTVFIVGPLFTTLSLSSYFTSKGFFSYSLHNVVMIFGAKLELPGVFLTNPFPSNVNGSLWTLPYEIGMYAILLALWIGVKSLQRVFKITFQGITLALTGVLGLLFLLGISFPESRVFDDPDFVRLGFSFFSGVSYYIARDRIPLSLKLFCAVGCTILVSTLHSVCFQIMFALCAPYTILYLAYIPSGKIRWYNKIGDYSYGVYIYAFLVQQTLCAMIPGISVWTLTLYAGIVTLLFASASWHIIEKPALSLK